MAKRPVFYVDEQNEYRSVNVDFQWFPGFAKVQAQKSVRSLHAQFNKQHPQSRILEISTASEDPLGQAASAFNLQVYIKHSNEKYTVEQIFQASKTFRHAGNQEQLLRNDPAVMKRKIRKINDVDQLIAFDCGERHFPLEPKTYFYNWLYIHALNLPHNQAIARKIIECDAFTDIYFNPKKSFNCQAEAASIYVALYRRDDLEKAMKDEKSFLKYVYGISKSDQDQADHQSTEKSKPTEKKRPEQTELFDPDKLD